MIMSVRGLIVYSTTILIFVFSGTAFSKTVSEEMNNALSSDSLSLQIFFKTSRSDIDPSFSNNKENISRFFTSLDSIYGIPRVSIDSVVLVSSSASPEGATRTNDTLSRRRAAAAEALFRTHCKTDATFRIRTIGEDWQTLSALLHASNLKGKETALKIIGNTPRFIMNRGRIVGGRKKSMMDLQGGKVWREMNKHIFPLLRQATLTIYYTRHAAEEKTVTVVEEKVEEPDTLTHTVQPAVPVTATPAVPDDAGKPLFAVKTNLLADAATLVNIGIEVPIGERYSVAGMLYFPWWSSKANDITIQMFGGTLEGRYWLGDRSRKETMTGFFAGIYGGAGYFDFQLGNLSNDEGVQGDFYVMGGLSVGYAHVIGKRLRMEYSLGMGYLRSDYRKYKSAKGTKYGDIKAVEYPWEEKRISGFLPSKLEVSLVWLLHSKKVGKQ